MERLLDPKTASRFQFSLRVQLSLWVVVIFTLIQWVSTIVVWVILSGAVYSSFNEYFVRHSIEVSALIDDDISKISRKKLATIESEQLTQARFNVFAIDVFDTAGQRVTEPGAWIAQLDQADIDHAMQSPGPVLLDDMNWSNSNSSVGEAHMIVVIQRVIGRDRKPYILLQATNDVYAQDRVMQIGQTLLVISLAAPFLALLAGWFISRIAVAPLTRVQELVSSLTPESLTDPLEIKEESSEVMELVAQIDDSRNQIKKAFESQARFISNVSHELKTPIAVMQIEAQTLDLNGASDDMKQFARSVQDEMARLGKMIESFLTLTRLEDGFGKVGGSKYAFNDMVMDSMDQCVSMSSLNAIMLDPILFADDDTMELAVRGDADLLITMLNNLVRNAIGYSPAAGVVSVELKQVLDGQGAQRVHILVSDQGPGIPPEKIDHIFDRFAQAENADRSGRGHGLGLAIAQGIAELHGGSISVANNPGNGCTFTVDLPAINDQNNQNDQAD